MTWGGGGGGAEAGGGVPGGGVAGGASLARGGSRSHLSGREVALSFEWEWKSLIFFVGAERPRKNLEMYLLHPQIFSWARLRACGTSKMLSAAVQRH